VLGHTDIGQFAGTVSPGFEQTDCIRPLMHWQTHFACTSVEQISPKPRTAIFRNRVICRLQRPNEKRPQPGDRPGPSFLKVRTGGGPGRTGQSTLTAVMSEPLISQSFGE